MPEISMKKMMEAGAHFGHQTRRWNPKMRPYIYGDRNGIYILDLQKAVPLVAKACVFAAKTVAEGGSILFVGTKKQSQGIIKEEAARAKMYYVTHRWLGGLLTNFKTIRTGIERLKKIDAMIDDGSIEHLVKKERTKISKEKVKLERTLFGIKEMSRLPSALFIVDPQKENIAVKEAQRIGIPIIAIVDTNCNPDPIDYVIPCNDDSSRSVSLVASWIADSCLEGWSRREEKISAEIDKGDGSAQETSAVETDEEGLVIKKKRRRRTPEVESTENTSEVVPTDSALLQ